MTSATKPIWIVTFKSGEVGTRLQHCAAIDLNELLQHFNYNGQQQIIKIEKTELSITYWY
jgi:hypothetical protein